MVEAEYKKLSNLHIDIELYIYESTSLEKGRLVMGDEVLIVANRNHMYA